MSWAAKTLVVHIVCSALVMPEVIAALYNPLDVNTTLSPLSRGYKNKAYERFGFGVGEDRMWRLRLVSVGTTA